MSRSITISVGLLAFVLLMPGCAVTEISVSNPMPEVRRVAIAPFINLSTEPDVDLGARALFGGGYTDRRFAQAYYAELQKVPGYEVIPVGVVEQAIAASNRPMNGPADYLEVCNAIGADAIVVGAVTDYDPYHPRLGVQVQWYTQSSMQPPAPTMPFEREWDETNYRDPEGKKGLFSRGKNRKRDAGHPADCGCVSCRTVRAQSPEMLSGAIPQAEPPAVMIDTAALPIGPTAESLPPIPEQLAAPMGSVSLQEAPWAATLAIDPGQTAEILPLYSYTRMFDGRDARLTARLRDYVDLSGDMRSGGWEGYLNRSDDFIRFACHVLIEEMLMLHGGESSRRVVFKHRRELSRKL